MAKRISPGQEAKRNFREQFRVIEGGCKPNEEYKECGPARQCEPFCSRPTQPCTEPCVKGCFCKRNFTRVDLLKEDIYPVCIPDFACKLVQDELEKVKQFNQNKTF